MLGGSPTSETQQHNDLIDWLQGRSFKASRIILSRAMLRLLPVPFSAVAESWLSDEVKLRAIDLLRFSLIEQVRSEHTELKIDIPEPPSLRRSEHMRRSGGPYLGRLTGILYIATSILEAPTVVAQEDVGRLIEQGSRGEALFLIPSASAGVVFMQGQSWATVCDDIVAYDEGFDLLAAPLWPSGGPLLKEWDATRSILKNLPGGSFWIDWYQRLLDGRPQDWDLLRKVALIDHETWHQGGDDLARAISALHQDHALNATRNGEEVRLNPETGRLRLVPASDLPEDRAEYVRRKIIKAANIFDDQGGQAYGALAADLNMLRRTVADAGNLPVELYDACSSALRRLDVRIASGECPSAGQDALIGDYRDRLRDAAMDILGSDTEAQDVLERRAAISDNPALIEARDTVLAFADQTAPLLEGHLAEVLPDDAELATDPGAEPQERAAASYRLSGRILRVARVIRSGLTGTSGMIVQSAKYVQAMEFLANSPLIKAIFRYLGL